MSKLNHSADFRGGGGGNSKQQKPLENFCTKPNSKLFHRFWNISYISDHIIINIAGIKLKFKLSKKVKQKIYPKLLSKNNNKIIIHKLNGEIEYNKPIPGINIDFLGKNSVVEVFEPFNFKNCNFTLNDECIVKIGVAKALINQLYVTMMYSESCNVTIGEKFTCNSCQIDLWRNKNISVTIGDDCMFSAGILIKTNDAHTIYDLETKKVLNPPNSVTIGDHVWICRDAKILKNVTIPDNCTVGIGSIVTKNNFEKNSIIAGIPAKTVKRNVNWAREHTYDYEKKLAESQTGIFLD